MGMRAYKVEEIRTKEAPTFSFSNDIANDFVIEHGFYRGDFVVFERDILENICIDGEILETKPEFAKFARLILEDFGDIDSEVEYYCY